MAWRATHAPQPVIWTRAEIIAAPQRWWQEHGRPPTGDDYERDRYLPGTATLYRTFRSIQEVRQEATNGTWQPTRVRRQPKWSRARILWAVKRWRLKHGREPAWSDFTRDRDLPSVHVVYQHFRSMAEIRAAAHHEPEEQSA